MGADETKAIGWLDTNVILRYLLSDHPDHSARAQTLIERAERGEIRLHVPLYILCETLYILESNAYTRDEISDALSRFLTIPGVTVDNLPVVQMSIAQYWNLNVDFVDALMYSQCNDENGMLYTFNKRHFDRLGNQWREP